MQEITFTALVKDKNKFFNNEKEILIMKKFIALVIAIVMMAAIAVPAFAVNETTGDTVVTYTTEDSYTVTIPATLAFDGTENLSIVANYANDVTITVTVDDEEAFLLSGNEATYAYVLKVDGTAVEAGDTVAQTTEAQGTATVALTCAWAEDVTAPEQAGTYTDTLTFNVAVA